MAYLPDIFTTLSYINRKLQGSDNIPFRVCNKINMLKQKLSFRDYEAKKGKISLFPCLQSLMKNELHLSQTLLNDIREEDKPLQVFPENLVYIHHSNHHHRNQHHQLHQICLLYTSRCV